MLEPKHKDRDLYRRQVTRSGWVTIYVIESSVISMLVLHTFIEEFTPITLSTAVIRQYIDELGIVCGLFGLHQFIVASVQLVKKSMRAFKVYLALSVIYLAFFGFLFYSHGQLLDHLNRELGIILVLLPPASLSWWFTFHQIKNSKIQSALAEMDQEDILDYFE